MRKIRSFFRDAHARALTVAFALTGVTFALTGGALVQADETAQIASSGTVGTYSIVPALELEEPEDDCTTKECQEYRESSAVEKIMTSQFRPRTVWESGTYSFYSDFDNLLSDQLIKSLDRSMLHAAAMNMGNFLSFTASDFVINSVEFDPLSEVGATIDIVGDQIFTALTGGNTATGLILIAVGVVAVIITAMFQALRGQQVGIIFKRTGALLAVLTLFFTMGQAALERNEEAEGIENSASYESTPGTPLWAAMLVNTWLGKISATVADSFMGTIDTVDDATLSASGQGLFGCGQYVKAMNENFADQVAVWAPNNASVSIVRVMDQMWLTTGLETWKDAQFGQINDYGDKVWCHVLNVDTHVSYDTMEANFEQMAINQGFTFTDYRPAQDSATNNQQHQDATSGLPGGNNYPTTAFKHPEGAQNDVTHLGWTICRAVEDGDGWTWELESGWRGWEGRGGALANDTKLVQLCDLWWRFRTPDMPDPDNGYGGKDAPDEFETSASDAIEDAAKVTGGYVAVQDFAGHLSGASASGAGAAVWGYAFGSLGTFIAFGFVALIVFVAKIFTIVFTITIWFVVLAAMFSPSPFKKVIGKSFSKFVGVSLVASMVTALMAVVVIITNVLMRVGVAIFGEGQLMTMLWAGASPVMALIALNMIFKKAFHVPSPLSISGAQSWGKAGVSGAAGVAAGAGVMAGVGRLAKGAARTAGREGTKGLMSKASGGRLGGYRGGNNTKPGRRSAMDAQQGDEQKKLTPTGREKAGVHDTLEATRERDEDGRLISVSNAADSAGRKEMRHDRAGDEAARRREETQQLRDYKSELKAGGMSRGEVRAQMAMRRRNVREDRDARTEELGLGIRERLRTRALRAKARPGEAANATLDSASHRITQGGGSRGVDSKITRFANTRVGTRLTRAAHLRNTAAETRSGGPKQPTWREQTAGTTRAERDSTRASQRDSARDRAEKLADAEASKLLDRVGSDDYGQRTNGGDDQAALNRLEKAQRKAGQREMRRETHATRRAADRAVHAPSGEERKAAEAAYRRQNDQRERARRRQERRAADNQARQELMAERIDEITDQAEATRFISGGDE